MPVIVAGFLYYLLHPLVVLIDTKTKIPHLWSVTIVFFSFLILIIFLFFLFVPHLIAQLSSMLSDLPRFASHIQRTVNDWLQAGWFKRLGWEINTRDIENQIDRYSSTFLSFSLSGLGNVVSFLTGFTINLITIPIMLFYMLADGHKFIPFVNRLFLSKREEEVDLLARQMNGTISRYIGGQVIEGGFVMTCTIIGYLIVKQPFAPLLGLFAGICVLIPYIGPFISAIPSLLVAVSISTQQVLAVVLIVLIVSQLDGNLIYPNAIGRNLKIHPMTILVILLSAGNIWGLFGMILGVPAYAVIRTLVIFFYNLYHLKKNSRESKEMLVKDNSEQEKDSDEKGIKDGSKNDTK